MTRTCAAVVPQRLPRCASERSGRRSRAKALSLSAGHRSRTVARALDCAPRARTWRVARGMSLQADLRANPTLSFELRQEPGGTDNATDVGIEWPLELFRRGARVAVADGGCDGGRTRRSGSAPAACRRCGGSVRRRSRGGRGSSRSPMTCCAATQAARTVASPCGAGGDTDARSRHGGRRGPKDSS